MRDREAIEARSQARELVGAARVGDRRGFFAAGDIQETNHGARKDAAGLVGDLALDVAGPRGRGKKGDE